MAYSLVCWVQVVFVGGARHENGAPELSTR